MSDRVDNIYVEVQIRTIAMDFWASLEHKIYYKYNKEVPAKLVEELKEAADSVSQLDEKMESINREVSKYKENNDYDEGLEELLINNERFSLPKALLLQYLKLDE
jgi:putative GTP pyrophosphokinase